ncbi:eukaryotic mitochondrial regulator protein-domain-containing protein [Nemania sp. NC0429]|nr:eukaryotic mitochondrial regulator protein-domain-containing protein [Nemania sp. NC0429]
MPPLLPTTTSLVRASTGAASRITGPLGTPVVVAAATSTASFSTTASRSKISKPRQEFRAWEKRIGRNLRRPQEQGPRYLPLGPSSRGEDNVDRPFPINGHFKSARVLDDSSRELIWEKVMREGEPIKAVSAEFGVDIRRVAAIVRLKEVEKAWIAKGKKLAKPYAKAVLSMLPTWRLASNSNAEPFEPINELHVHPYTMQQIFWPTSESRHFTREDAAKAFHPTLLSADKRVPHPELIQMEREIQQGRPPYDASERFRQAVMESERKAAERQMAQAALEEKLVTRVKTDRFEFRFKQYNSENVGLRGRARHVVGWRYGNPFDDRAKGHQIKIPTSVP